MEVIMRVGFFFAMLLHEAVDSVLYANPQSSQTINQPQNHYDWNFNFQL